MISSVYSIRPFSNNLTQIKCDCANVASTYDAIQCQLCTALLQDLFYKTYGIKDPHFNNDPLDFP